MDCGRCGAAPWGPLAPQLSASRGDLPERMSEPVMFESPRAPEEVLHRLVRVRALVRARRAIGRLPAVRACRAGGLRRRVGDRSCRSARLRRLVGRPRALPRGRGPPRRAAGCAHACNAVTLAGELERQASTGVTHARGRLIRSKRYRPILRRRRCSNGIGDRHGWRPVREAFCRALGFSLPPPRDGCAEASPGETLRTGHQPLLTYSAS